jgi:hypothetical protein
MSIGPQPALDFSYTILYAIVDCRQFDRGLYCRGTGLTVRGSVAIWDGALPDGRANAPLGFLGNTI